MLSEELTREENRALVKLAQAEANDFEEMIERTLKLALKPGIKDARLAGFFAGRLSLLGPVKALFAAIKHGDEKHQAWLKDAIEKHFELPPGSLIDDAFAVIKEKSIEVQYIESGSFQGGEEECFTKGAKTDMTCWVYSPDFKPYREEDE